MTRLIKKYPNRRLYDTAESRYITLADIRDLVINGVDFSVIDKKSGDVITRAILLQVISEQEQARDPIMSEAFLAHVIRAYGTGAPGFLARHLEKSLTTFIAQQNNILEHVNQSVAGDSVQSISQDQKKAS
jgi:polyhydroxyalkanoate synthesis repressor PhaR